jgi:[amino group carrier protein]-6-phospho-L-2-aminoadipate/5-phospho-L-glutamate reductase
LADNKLQVAIAGASGYTGGELTRLLLDHPQVELAFLSSERHAGRSVASVHPALRNHPAAGNLRFRALRELSEVDVAFGCLSTGALPARLPLIAERAKRVLNVAGDFRLHDPREEAAHYPATTRDPALERFAYYIPELSGAVPDSRFLNLPGCMAVATIYALYPLFAGALVHADVIIDAKSGSTGGGRGGDEHPAERAGNFRPHKLHGHRHAPEIRQALTDITGNQPDLQFSTHSLDVSRGIFITAYARLLPSVTEVDVRRAFVSAYRGKPFVRVRPTPKSAQDWPMLKSVVGSNVAEVAVAVRDDRCVVVAALDNLIKGAAGQAIQALNLANGLAETLSLPMTAVSP